MRRVVTLPVRSIRAATPRTRIVQLDLDGPFHYRAGQAVALGLPGHPHRRPYSIACAPEQAARTGQLEFLIKVDPRGDPGGPLAGLRRGARVDVEGPFGRFSVPDGAGAGRFLFVAGGTGIAPIRAMMWHVLLTARPASLTVLYSARTPAEFAYLGELRRLARRGRIRLLLTASRDASPSWTGGRGRISAQDLAPLIEHPATWCFLCGPQALVADLAPRLEHLGVAAGRIRTEDW